MTRFTAAAGLVLLLAAGTIHAEDAPVRVTAAELADAYRTNPVAADLAFKGTRLRVAGTIARIGKTDTDDPLIILDHGIAVLDVNANKAATLRRGQRVEAVCTGDGVDIIRDCFIN